jgi:hypothetical protein
MRNTLAGGTPSSSLVDGVLTVPRGGHLCLFYDEDPHEQLPVVLPFISQGLSSGERCVYVADDLTVFQLHQALAGAGVDAVTEMARGALLLLTRADWRQPGELCSDSKAQQVRGMIESALDAGFTGVRFGIEMTWTLGPTIDAAALRHWEATINTIFTPELPARIICQYSRWRLTSGALHAGLVTHPQAVVGNGLYANPFYGGPAILSRNSAYDPGAVSDDSVRNMLEQLLAS